MLNLKSRHLMTGEELGAQGIHDLLDLAEQLKRERNDGILREDLAGQTLALLFEKQSLRTHVSFTVAMTELGGKVVDTFSSSRKKEEPEDVVRVLNGFVHGIMIRTHEHSIVERMASKARIPIINGLSDSHHPCQVLADLLTLKERLGKLKGVTLAYIGDGNNMLNSLLLLLPMAGVKVRFSCPKGYEPDPTIVAKAGDMAQFLETPELAVQGANAVYTDVWTSMGFEEEQAAREKAFAGYQLDEALHSKAAPGALVMHCLPMERGKEISAAMAEHPHSVLFQQSENRLHVQKALILALMKK
jgi:ornithine carbamoyltransferase